MFAGDEPPLPIARITVRIVSWLAKDTDSASLLLPFHEAIVGDIAPQKIATVAKPNGAFRPAQAGGDSFYLGECQPIFRETWIDDPD
jgi:hypothetical protein